MRTSSMAIRCLGSLLTVAFVACAAEVASAQFSISHFTIDGGGGTRSTGGIFALGGTIGQPDAGRLSGSSFTLKGGFWSGGGTVTAVGGETPGDGVGLPNAPPLSFQMYPASPNPLGEWMAVAFDLPEPSFVRVALYDASGRLVRILADGPLPAGKHQRAWDRRNRSEQPVPPGIYFLRLEAGAHKSHQKIVVVS